MLGDREADRSKTLLALIDSRRIWMPLKDTDTSTQKKAVGLFFFPVVVFGIRSYKGNVQKSRGKICQKSFSALLVCILIFNAGVC
jgi:hypothetical protein